jgi:hypothetical protein
MYSTSGYSRFYVSLSFIGNWNIQPFFPLEIRTSFRLDFTEHFFFVTQQKFNGSRHTGRCPSENLKSSTALMIIGYTMMTKNIHTVEMLCVWYLRGTCLVWNFINLPVTLSDICCFSAFLEECWWNFLQNTCIIFYHNHVTFSLNNM